MTPTIYSFTRALLSPQTSFATLGDVHADTTPAGTPRLSRTARFAEAQIEWQGARWLLCMPLTSAAVPDMERTAAHLHTLRSEWLAEYRLLRDEMHYEDSAGSVHRSDLILQALPAGCTFTEALDTEQPQRLLDAIDALEAELSRLGISHRNIKPENLRWCGGRLIPIRYHYARTGQGGDAEAFRTLRAEILSTHSTPQTAHDVQAGYNTPADRFTGHHWVGNAFEQLVCVEDDAGFGYVDTSNHPVIAAQYLWADDFHEGRAAVETPQGMGLIDKSGRYIIPPTYEIVEYDPATGRSQVRLDGRWAEFDYEGRQIGEFATCTN